MMTHVEAAKSAESLDRFIRDIGAWTNNNEKHPQPGSVADSELAAFPHPSAVQNAYWQGGMMLEVAAENLALLLKALSPPTLTISCWTTVRAVLESSAIGAWLLDNRIDATTRAKRCFALRYEGMVQQRKLAVSHGDAAAQAQLDARLLTVEAEAVSLGYPLCVNRKGDRNGIAQVMPSVTEIIRDTLHAEAEYRLLSMVAHCHVSALHQVGFKIADRDTDGTVLLEKHITPESVHYLCCVSFMAVVRPLWHQGYLLGLDCLSLERSIEEAADRLRIEPRLRFWRSA